VLFQLAETEVLVLCILWMYVCLVFVDRSQAASSLKCTSRHIICRRRNWRLGYMITRLARFVCPVIYVLWSWAFIIFMSGWLMIVDYRIEFCCHHWHSSCAIASYMYNKFRSHFSYHISVSYCLYFVIYISCISISDSSPFHFCIMSTGHVIVPLSPGSTTWYWSTRWTCCALGKLTAGLSKSNIVLWLTAQSSCS